MFLKNCQSNSKQAHLAFPWWQKIGVHGQLPYIRICIITGRAITRHDCIMTWSLGVGMEGVGGGCGGLGRGSSNMAG